MASRFDEDLSHALEAVRGRVLRDLRVAVPAEVTRYDATHQLVDVRPLLADWFPSEGENVEQAFPPIVPNVPVVFPGSGGYRLTFPVAVGDTLLLVVSDRSLDAWLDQGGRQAPDDLRRHNLSDAVAIPGLHDNRHAWTGAATDHVTLGKDGGPQVHLKATTIELGSSATQAAVNGSAFMTALDTMLKALDTYLAAIVGSDSTIAAAMALGGPASPTAVYTAARSTFAAVARLSNTVKVQP
jgi:hypothetical protein